MKIWKTGIILAGVLFLGGCKHVPESKTILLPEEDMEQGIVLQGEEGDRYTVRKIYTKEYETLWYEGYTAFLPGNESHEVRLAQTGDNGLEMLTMDYRYGFFDAEPCLVADIIESHLKTWSAGGQEDTNKSIQLFSPDGKYLLYETGEESFTGSRLYLMNTKTMETELLLDGDELKCPGDDFMILTAWVRDASLLCYGFYPRNSTVWNTYGGQQFVFYYRDMETGKIINRLNYSYAGTTGKAEDLQSSQLYVDWNGKKILTVLKTDQYYEEGIRLDLFPQDVGEGLITEGVVMPSLINCTGDKVFLDAENERVYIVSRLNEEGVLCFDITDAFLQYNVPIEEINVVKDFLVLDKGEAFVTAEYSENQNRADICLYMNTENGYVRRVLYRDAGYVLRLQYDYTSHRLLAETGHLSINEEYESANASATPDIRRSILVLEF
ncbi:MAG: hypothetical protein HFJ10_14380 [Lachnospiraceae bacterium]|nr:hypothetical protein [Lachnospiraceae bacterium]